MTTGRYHREPLALVGAGCGAVTAKTEESTDYCLGEMIPRELIERGTLLSG